MGLVWQSTLEIASVGFTCGWCHREVASQHGWTARDDDERHRDVAAIIAICHRCTAPTVILDADRYSKVQMPPPSPGRHVQHLPDDVQAIYTEARRACGAGAWTAAAMALRAVIAYVAVDRDAPKGRTFQQYVDWLAEHHYLPPGGAEWVKQIKDTGNDAAHELTPLGEDVVQLVLDFTELLLRFVYEATGRMRDDARSIADIAAEGEPG